MYTSPLHQKKDTVQGQFFKRITEVCIYPAPPPQTGYDRRLILKRCKAGLYSEFSFFQTGNQTKCK